MKKEKSCGAIIINNKDEILLIKHNVGHWAFPKGHIENNETDELCALREIKEETNLDVNIITNIKEKTTYSPKEGILKDVIYFVALPINNDIKLQQEEVNDYLWLPLKDALNKLTYDNDKKIVRLLGGKPEEGKELEFVALSQYLFDESHSVRDVKAVAIDFEDTLREELGAKKTLDRRSVAMPTRAAAGETPTIEAFTKGFLDICPQYKGNYQDMLASGGSFMYVEFYSKYGIEKMQTLIADNNEKQLGKFLTFLNKYYLEGDRTVVAVITTIFFGGTFCKDRENYNKIVAPRLEDMTYLKAAAESSIEYAAKNKKLQAALNLQ